MARFLGRVTEELSHKGDLSEVEREVLRLVATVDAPEGNAAELYAPLLQLSSRQVSIYLHSLDDKNYLTYVGLDGAAFFDLSDKGRAYVLANNLM